MFGEAGGLIKNLSYAGLLSVAACMCPSKYLNQLFDWKSLPRYFYCPIHRFHSVNGSIILLIRFSAMSTILTRLNSCQLI